MSQLSEYVNPKHATQDYYLMSQLNENDTRYFDKTLHVL
jgi:hypothetical protein